MYRKKASKLIPHEPNLPKLPANILDWIKQARPIVEGRLRTFLAFPFWVDIYKDLANRILVMAGRQVFKSTWLTDVLAHGATTNNGATFVYVTHDELSLSGFSNQKFRIGTLEQNPLLKLFVRGGGIGKISEVGFENNSRIYLTTDQGGYGHVEGKSPQEILLDEVQYQELEFLPKLVESMSQTKGKLKLVGIGGEGGSELERLWLETDQREWVYDNPNWRETLQFKKGKGLIIDDYLKDVLKGRWITKGKSNTLFHGYHIPQHIFPTTPLTIQDAIEKYEVDPSYSIEWKQKNYPQSILKTHVFGTFYKATRRPVTREMVLACMMPYRMYNLMKTTEIAELKELYKDNIKISMGVDFGSGISASSTVISILIEWKMSKGHPSRYQLAFIDRRPAENQLDQAEYINRIFKEAKCDIGIGDLGYGTNQVKLIQDGGFNRQTGDKFSGVGSYKFIGCRTIGDETKPLQTFDDKIDEHGEESGRISIDKTSKIQEFIDMLEFFVTHPIYPDNEDIRRPRLMIPYKEEYKVDWLIKDFTDITRKDLEEVEDVVTIDPRQRARKEFNHPRDSVMSIIYAVVGLEKDIEYHWVKV